MIERLRPDLDLEHSGTGFLLQRRHAGTTLLVLTMLLFLDLLLKKDYIQSVGNFKSHCLTLHDVCNHSALLSEITQNTSFAFLKSWCFSVHLGADLRY